MRPELEDLLRSHWTQWFAHSTAPRQVRLLKVNGSLSPRGCATLFGFADTAPVPALVIRVPRTSEAETLLAAQFSTLEALRRALPPALAETITRPIGLLPAAGTRIGVEYAFAGRSMAAVASRAHAQIKMEFQQALAWLVEFHRNTDRPVRMSAKELRQRVLGAADGALERAGLTPAEGRYLESLVERAQAAAERPLPCGWGHGDFWPRNVLMDHGRLQVVDWEHCRRDALPFGDVLLFPLGYGWALAYGRKLSPLQAFQMTFCEPGFMLAEAQRFVRGYFRARELHAGWWDIFAPLALLELELRQDAPQAGGRPRLARFRFLAQHPDALRLL